MKSKSLHDKAPTLNYQGVHEQISSLIELGRLDEIEILLRTDCLTLINNLEEVDQTFSLFENILTCIHNHPGNYSTLRETLINSLGVLCGRIGLRKEALNFYILALICSETKRASTYCNNIGAALADFGDFYLAKKFYREALELNDFVNDVSTDADKRLHNIVIINQAIANLNLGKRETAKANLSLIYHLEEGLISDIYRFANWHIEISDFNSLEEAYSYIKRLEEDKSGSRLVYTYFLRKYLFEKYKNIPIEMQYSILFGSFGIHDLVTNIDDKKDTILQLIRLSKELDRKEDQAIFHEALYQITLSETNHNNNATRILVEQYLQFFNNLSNTNKKTKHQKEELTKLTFLLSHHLKTPVRNINGFTDLIRKKIEPEKDNDIEEYFGFVNKGCSELYQLLDNINQIAHFNSKTEKELEVDLNFLIKQIEQDLRRIHQNSVNVTCKNQLPTLLARPSDMKNLFAILIENGIKFNVSNQPEISIAYQEKQDKIVLFITDNGIGIEQTYQNKIFDFFTKLEANHVFPGTGFGLGMAKKILDYYNGNIKLVKSDNQGSVFSFELPKSMRLDDQKQQRKSG